MFDLEIEAEPRELDKLKADLVDSLEDFSGVRSVGESSPGLEAEPFSTLLLIAVAPQVIQTVREVVLRWLDARREREKLHLAVRTKDGQRSQLTEEKLRELLNQPLDERPA